MRGFLLKIEKRHLISYLSKKVSAMLITHHDRDLIFV